jgi:hypothetical protein
MHDPNLQHHPLCRLRHSLGHMLFDSTPNNLSISTEQVDGSIVDVFSVSHHCVSIHVEGQWPPPLESDGECAHRVAVMMKPPLAPLISYEGHEFHVPPTISSSDAVAYAKDNFLAEHTRGTVERVSVEKRSEGTRAFHEQFYQHAQPLYDLYHALYGEHGIVGRDNSNALRLYLLALDLIKEHAIWKRRRHRRKLQFGTLIGDMTTANVAANDPACSAWGVNGAFTPTFSLDSSTNRPKFSTGFDYCNNNGYGADYPAHSGTAAASHLATHKLPVSWSGRSGPLPWCGQRCGAYSSGTCSSPPHCGTGSSQSAANTGWLTGMCGPNHRGSSTTHSGLPECWPGVCGDCCNWKGCWDHDCGIISNGRLTTYFSYLDNFCVYGYSGLGLSSGHQVYCTKGYRVDGTNCRACSTGQYQDNQPFSGTQCTSCPSGRSTSSTGIHTSSSSCVPTSSSGCSGNQGSRYGSSTYSSVSFSLTSYTDNNDCYWTLSCSNNLRPRVTFTSFDTEYGWDFVYLCAWQTVLPLLVIPCVLTWCLIVWV